MSREKSAICWHRLKDWDKKRLLHLISEWFVRGESHQMIGKKMRDWMKKEAPDCYEQNGALPPSFVGRRIAEAAKLGMLETSRFYEEELSEQIIQLLYPHRHLKKIEIIVAPDSSEMLRYVWLDLDRILVQKLRSRSPIIVGVSGGRTMLELANAAPKIADMTWHEDVPLNKRLNVIICSLTSGGTRSNIAALSDTVTANLAQYLGAQTKGLLGPAYFSDSSALSVFKNDPDIKDHMQLVQKADIILTSVGFLNDTNALMRQLLNQAGQSKFVEERDNLADMLYNCYDGFTGESVDLPQKVTDRLFSVINLQQLRQKVNSGDYCMVLAVGEEKGRYALPGLLRKQMASHVYMDRACAKGLIKALSD